MPAPHYVELARWVVARRVRLGENLVESARVGPLLLGHPRERAEHARVAEDADVRGVDVLIRGEEDPVAVAPAVCLGGGACGRAEGRGGETGAGGVGGAALLPPDP